MIDYDTLCECGCPVREHHDAFICKTNKFPEDTGRWCAENRTDFPHAHGAECEAFGFNEMGGMKFNEETGEWEKHCRTLTIK